MNNFFNNSIDSLKPALTIGLIAGLLCVLVLACGGTSQPPPEAYVGTWTGDDKTVITIRGDGGADYKAANSSVNGGAVAVDEAAKTLKITFMRMGPSFTIDKPPSADQMTLSGVVYKKGGPGVPSGNTTGSPTPGVDTAQADPDERLVQRLVGNSVADLADAVETDDFSLFYDNASTDFQNTFTLDEVKAMFKTFVDKKADIVPVLKQAAAFDADFSAPIKTRTQNGLKIVAANGRFDTKPAGLNFETEYVNRAGEWKMLTFVVNLK